MRTVEHQLTEYHQPHTYTERLGVGADETLELLAKPPERPLSPEERAAFFAIDTGLVEGRYDQDIGNGVENTPLLVEGWYKDVSPPVNLVVGYFTTPAGHQELEAIEQQLGLQAASHAEHTGVATAQRLARLGAYIGGKVELKAKLSTMAKHSQQWTVSSIETALQKSEPLEDSPHVYVFTEPKQVLDRVQQVQQERQFLKAVRHDLRQRADITPNVRDALLVSVDGLRQKTTEMLGILYPQMTALYHQALLLKDSEPAYAQRLTQMLIDLSQPIHRIVTAAQQKDVEERFVKTMDRWRSGVVKGEQETSFSEKLLQLEATLDQQEMSEDALPCAFTPEEIAKLDAIECDAALTADLTRYILERNNLLSADTTFKKGSWPTDSSTQHPRIGVIVGDFTNLAYANGWIMIPENTKRKLRQQAPSGPALVVPHEIQHAIDGITAQYGNQQVAITRVGARNSVGVREGVGKQEEDLVSRALFGQPLKQSTAYLKALRAWGETDSESAAIVAYAEQVVKEAGGQTITRKALTQAQNRVQRLIKSGVQPAAGWNSQALVYIEQMAVAESLQAAAPNVQRTVAANSYLDLPLMARFHQFNVLATERYQPAVPPVQAVEEYLRKLLASGDNK